MTEPDPTKKVPQPGANAEVKEGFGKRILVADDDKQMGPMFVRVLEGRGYKVDLVENGQLLLDKLNSGEKYDLILTDNTMPVMPGIVALEQIHKDERFNKIPIIMASGDADPELDAKAQSLGAYCLNKPFGLMTLANKVKDLIAEHKE